MEDECFLGPAFTVSLNALPLHRILRSPILDLLLFLLPGKLMLPMPAPFLCLADPFSFSDHGFNLFPQRSLFFLHYICWKFHWPTRIICQVQSQKGWIYTMIRPRQRVRMWGRGRNWGHFCNHHIPLPGAYKSWSGPNLRWLPCTGPHLQTVNSFIQLNSCLVQVPCLYLSSTRSPITPYWNLVKCPLFSKYLNSAFFLWNSIYWSN